MRKCMSPRPAKNRPAHNTRQMSRCALSWTTHLGDHPKPAKHDPLKTGHRAERVGTLTTAGEMWSRRPGMGNVLSTDKQQQVHGTCQRKRDNLLSSLVSASL